MLNIENKDYLFLLDEEQVEWYIPILDISKKFLLKDSIIHMNITFKDIYKVNKHIYNFMFCKEYYAQFKNSQNTNYWDYNNKNLDAMVTMETSEVTVYDKELKKINEEISKKFKIQLKNKDIPKIC